MAGIYGTSSQEWTGWAPQPTIGSPVSPSERLPTMAGGADANYNIGMVAVDIAGQPVQVADWVPGMGNGTWQATFRLHPTSGRTFIANNGLGAAGIVVPQRFTLYVHSAGQSWLYGGCFCTRTRITSQRNSQGGVMVAMNGILTEEPTPVAPIAPIALTVDTPFTHNNMLPVTLLGGAVTDKDCKTLDVTLDTPFVTDGGEGVDIPNIVAYNGCSVSGSIGAFFTAAYVAEFNAALAKTPGALDATWTNAAGSATLRIGAAKYQSAQFTRPKNQIDLLDLKFGALSDTLDAATYASLS